MLDLEKILDDWNKMTEDEKFAYVQFTYILCDYFGGDVNWCDREGDLSNSEKKVVTDRLPEHLNKKIIAEDRRRREESCRELFPFGCSDVMERACKDTRREFLGWHLSDTVKYRIITYLSEAIETALNNTWWKDTLELKLVRLVEIDGKPRDGLFVTFTQKEFKWTKGFLCCFEDDNVIVKEVGKCGEKLNCC